MQILGERDASGSPCAWHLGPNPTLEALSTLTRLSRLCITDELCPCLMLSSLLSLTALRSLRLRVVPAGELGGLAVLSNLQELAFIGEQA